MSLLCRFSLSNISKIASISKKESFFLFPRLIVMSSLLLSYTNVIAFHNTHKTLEQMVTNLHKVLFPNKKLQRDLRTKIIFYYRLNHGTIMKTGITCKKISCYMRATQLVGGLLLKMLKYFEVRLTRSLPKGFQKQDLLCI